MASTLLSNAAARFLSNTKVFLTRGSGKNLKISCYFEGSLCLSNIYHFLRKSNNFRLRNFKAGFLS